MRNLSYGLWLLLVFAPLVYSSDSEFAGEWRLEKEIALGNGLSFVVQGPDADFGISVAHNGYRFQVRNKCNKCTMQMRDYIIDGAERNMPSNMGMITYRAKLDDNGLVLDQSYENASPFGKVMTSTKQVWSLSADKQMLIVLGLTQSQGKTISVTQIYRRQ